MSPFPLEVPAVPRCETSATWNSLPISDMGDALHL